MSSFYIITFSKVHHKITQEQRDAIMKPSFSEADINGQLVKVNNIADILDEQKYFETYPNKLPAHVRNDFEDLYGDIGNQQIRQPTKKAGELMKQGFVDYFVKERGLTQEEATNKFNAFI